MQSGITAPARTTQSWVADELRARIIVGTIPVGARLRQVDVATEFKVSTTPVREAFRALATEGLVQIDEHRGVVVRRLTQEQYQTIIADIFGADIKIGGRFEPDLRKSGLLAVGAGEVSVTPAPGSKRSAVGEVTEVLLKGRCNRCS